ALDEYQQVAGGLGLGGAAGAGQPGLQFGEPGEQPSLAEGCGELAPGEPAAQLLIVALDVAVGVGHRPDGRDRGGDEPAGEEQEEWGGHRVYPPGGWRRVGSRRASLRGPPILTDFPRSCQRQEPGWQIAFWVC